jgi:hypothetical protein
MRRLAWFAAGACWFGLLGCGEKAPINKHVRDPLLISKKPIEGKPDKPAPVAVAAVEPPAPTAPETAVATAPVKLESIGAGGVEHAGGPPAAKPPLNATPASRSGASAEVPAETVSRREPGRIYDHAADHAWLQGVIDKHYHGHLNLRYCDPSEDDAWGGKVMLLDDPKLAHLKDGDVVRVEGEIIYEDGKAKRGTWNHFVQYRIRDVQLIQGK